MANPKVTPALLKELDPDLIQYIRGPFHLFQELECFLQGFKSEGPFSDLLHYFGEVGMVKVLFYSGTGIPPMPSS